MALTRVDISLVSAFGVVQTPKQDTEPAISGITTEIWFSAGFFRDIVKDLGHPHYYETLYTACCRAMPLINLFIFFLYLLYSEATVCEKCIWRKGKTLFCQCSHIKQEVNNGLGYLPQLWDGAVFFSGCSRLFSILLWADSLLIGWKWPPECLFVCVCVHSSLSCIDKLIIIFTLNGCSFCVSSFIL